MTGWAIEHRFQDLFSNNALKTSFPCGEMVICSIIWLLSFSLSLYVSESVI